MPYEVSFFELPCGARAFRLELAGVFSGEEAVPYIKRTEPGGELHGLPVLVLTENLSSVSSDARGAFVRSPDRGEREPWVAAVVSSPVLRVTANFVLRVQPGRRRSKLFASEAEALQWLDARVREALAKKGEAS